MGNKTFYWDGLRIIFTLLFQSLPTLPSQQLDKQMSANDSLHFKFHLTPFYTFSKEDCLIIHLLAYSCIDILTISHEQMLYWKIFKIQVMITNSTLYSHFGNLLGSTSSSSKGHV